MLAEDDEDEPRGGATANDRSLRCSICALDWPPYEGFLECPSCGEPTTPFSHMIPMSVEEAQRLKLHYEFEAFYEKWDSSRPPERLNPS